MKNPLQEYKILVADADRELGNVVCSMLKGMGFANTQFTRSGKEAFDLLQTNSFDFLVTEWNTQEIDGLSLIRKIRCDPESQAPTIPILMLTGHAERADVIAARDCGINEYTIKPFSAKGIYDRLERIIEHPKQFVIDKSFIGPSRRNKSAPPQGVAERRAERPAAQLAPKTTAGLNDASGGPKLWLPDFSLKLKLGTGTTLKSLITPDVLNQSQAAINSIVSESLSWIKSDLNQLVALYQIMCAGNPPESLVRDISALALSLNSRAGTFGYTRASQIAYMLYLFCRNTLQPRNKDHHLVIKKHVDVLHVILGNQISGDAGEMGVQIMIELKNLAQKYAA